MLRQHEWQRESEFGNILWMLHHRTKKRSTPVDRFFVAGAWVRTRTSLYIRTLGEQNPPFTDGKQIADAFGVK